MSSAEESDGRAGIWLAALGLILTAAMFGGASRENPLRLATVEIASLPLLFLTLRHWRRFGLSRGAVEAIVLATLIAIIPALQLVPLPPGVWQALPGRAGEVAAARAAGVASNWLPMSLAPRETADALLALAPPLAMFLSPLAMGPRGLALQAGAWLGLGAAGLALGAAQLALAGPGPVYLYATTNYGSLVGFFANRNHEAAFLLALLPFAAVFAADAGRRAGRSDLVRIGGAVFGFLAVVGVGVVRSRAGLLLLPPTLAACAALFTATRSRGARGGKILAGAGVLTAITAVVVFSLSPILQRFTGSDAAEFRFEAWPIVRRAADAVQPFGAGVGAFDRVFRAAEPLAMVGPVYFNHAHNDWLEVWLETGWLGAGVATAVAVVLAKHGWTAWRGAGESALARAASVSILVLLGCSLVDYPLRTECLAIFFAWCCGLVLAQGRMATAAR